MYRRIFIATTVFVALVRPLLAREDAVSFRALDLWVDSGKARLAAYQVELAYDAESVKIVGIEGGEAKAFRAAPHYDRKGFEGGRIVVAAFTIDDDAPRGNTRVARIHLAIVGAQRPELSARLVTAAKPGGKRIKPKVKLRATAPAEGDKEEGA
jgi:hypothetical protein